MAGEYIPWEGGFVDTDVFPNTPIQNIQWTQDYAEANKMGPFYPQQSGVQWWEQAAMYGVTRAVDAAYMNSTVNKTAQPATYAGANGRTNVAGAVAGDGSGISPLVLLLIAGAIVFAVAD